MFGRTRKQLKAEIASLERALEKAHDELAVAVIPAGGLKQKVIVEKNVWHRASFMFMHTGAPELSLKDVFLGREDPHPAYFDGTTVTPE